MNDDRHTAWRLVFRYLPWAALGVYALYCIVFLVEPTWRPEWDGAIYLLTGRALALGEGYTYLGQPFFLRPPGLSWMLSLLVDNDAYNFHTVNLWVMVCAVAMVVTVYIAIRPLHGTWMALAVALLSGTSPLFLGCFNRVLTEFPFTASLFASVALLHKSAERGPRWWLWAVGGGLTLAAAVYLRTVGVLMVPALLLLGVKRDKGWQRWRAAVPVAIVILLVLPWLEHSREVAAVAPRPSEQLLLHSYSTAMWHQDPGDPDSPAVSPAGWMKRVEQNGSGLVRDVAKVTVHVDGVVLRTGLVVLLLAGWGMAVRRKPTLLEWFAASNLLLLLTYFTNAERLLMPLTPLLYLYLLLPLEAATRWLTGHFGRRAVAGQLLVVAALFTANAVSLPRRLAPRDRPIGARAARGQRWEELATWLRDNTPEDAVILCSRAPQVALLSGRTAYTYRFLRTPAPLTRYGVDYAVIDSATPPWILEYVQGRTDEYWELPSQVPGSAIRVCRFR